MESFAQRLTFLRESKDLKKKDLATFLNVSSSCISQYENGTNMPGYDTICRISQYFGVSVDYLIGNDTASLNCSLSNNYVDNVSVLSLIQECEKVPHSSRKALLEVISALQNNSEKGKST